MNISEYTALEHEIHAQTKAAQEAAAKSEVYRENLKNLVAQYEAEYGVKIADVDGGFTLAGIRKGLAAERKRVDAEAQAIADRFSEIQSTDYSAEEEVEETEPTEAETEEPVEVAKPKTQTKKPTLNQAVSQQTPVVSDTVEFDFDAIDDDEVSPAPKKPALKQTVNLAAKKTAKPAAAKTAKAAKASASTGIQHPAPTDEDKGMSFEDLMNIGIQSPYPNDNNDDDGIVIEF